MAKLSACLECDRTLNQIQQAKNRMDTLGLIHETLVNLKTDLHITAYSAKKN